MALTQVPPALLTATTGTGTTVVLSASPTFTGTVTTPSVTFSDASTQTAAASPYVLKNRIINGDMRIDQRNAGASVTPTSADVYVLDRWNCTRTQSSKYSVQQNAASVTPPAGFSNYQGITSLSAYSLLAGDYFAILQAVEGYNIADLAWGTASAATVTLSFWVRSSLTGTFGGVLKNSAANRSYPFTYTISVANTWEQKSITVAGDTSGTWLTTNGIGIAISFGLGVGTTFSGTAGAWAAANYVSATGATSVVGTNGATFYITGVQLEIGTSATPFERRLYNQELANCHRYCFRISGSTNGSPVGSGFWSNSTLVATYCKLSVPMRAAPTISYSAIGEVRFLDRDVAWRPATSSVVINEAGTDAVNVGAVCSTGSTQGFGTIFEIQGSTSWFQFSAEL